MNNGTVGNIFNKRVVYLLFTHEGYIYAWGTDMLSTTTYSCIIKNTRIGQRIRHKTNGSWNLAEKVWILLS